jgi:clan AA aspartic protease (TIGR02281 family)
MQAVAREHPGVDQATARRETDHLLYVLGCGLPDFGEQQAVSSSGSVAAPTSGRPQLNSSTDEVKIEKSGNGGYMVLVRVNQTIILPFILDTGAAELVIPADVVLTLIRAGALKGSDFIGKARYSMANGSEQVSDRVIIREVQVDDHIVTNVTASVGPPAGDLLLGQSFLSKFGAVTVDYKRLVLVLSR